jgi:hypothetical protein
MINCAVRMPEDGWQDALRVAGDLTVIRHLEVPGSVLLGEPDVVSHAERLGLKVLVAQDVLPGHVARYLAEAPVAGRADVPAALQSLVAECLDRGVRFVTLDVGLARAGDRGTGLRDRVALLRALMPTAGSARGVVCLQVRTPPEEPDSREMDYAANIVHDVMHPSCRLCVNVVPADLPDDFDGAAFVRDLYHSTALVRFHYSPLFGEDLDEDSQTVWATALRHHAFRGAVVFCPTVGDTAALPRVFADLERWAAMYMGL